MDTRLINATLVPVSFDPTGNPGEYTFTSAAYNNQADESGNGAYDVAVGWVLYVPSTNFNTGTLVPGVLHRYRLTAVTPVDPQTVSGTMVWDETGAEGLEVPTNGVGCGLSQVSPNLGLGYAPNDTLYPELQTGSTVESVQTDLVNIVDQHEGSSGPSSTYKTTIGDATTLVFVVHHALASLDVSATIYELSTGADVYADIARTGPNDVQITFTYPIPLNSHRVIVRS